MRIEFYRRVAVKKSKYKKGDKVLVYLPGKKTVKSIIIKHIHAAPSPGIVVDFERYYFGIDGNGNRVSFLNENDIKRLIK